VARNNNPRRKNLKLKMVYGKRGNMQNQQNIPTNRIIGWIIVVLGIFIILLSIVYRLNWDDFWLHGDVWYLFSEWSGVILMFGIIFGLVISLIGIQFIQISKVINVLLKSKEGKRICNTCGESIPTESTFCGHCGNRLT